MERRYVIFFGAKGARDNSGEALLAILEWTVDQSLVAILLNNFRYSPESCLVNWDLPKKLFEDSDCVKENELPPCISWNCPKQVRAFPAPGSFLGDIYLKICRANNGFSVRRMIEFVSCAIAAWYFFKKIPKICFTSENVRSQ